jgi:hypothetical protein
LGRLIDRKSEAAGSAGHELADRTNSLPGARFRLSTSIGDRTSRKSNDFREVRKRMTAVQTPHKGTTEFQCLLGMTMSAEGNPVIEPPWRSTSWIAIVSDRRTIN